MSLNKDGNTIIIFVATQKASMSTIVNCTRGQALKLSKLRVQILSSMPETAITCSSLGSLTDDYYTYGATDFHLEAERFLISISLNRAGELFCFSIKFKHVIYILDTDNASTGLFAICHVHRAYRT